MSNGIRVDAVSGGGFCCHVHVSRHYNLCNRVTGNLRTAEHVSSEAITPSYGPIAPDQSAVTINYLLESGVFVI